MSIRIESQHGVTTIEIARPERKNALTADMYQAMADALNTAQADGGVRAVLLVGHESIFTAGNDLEDFMKRPPGDEKAPVFQFMLALVRCEKPVIAAVRGAAIGIGVTLLMHCDFVYLAEDARLMMPFVGLGLVPEFASSFLLPSLMGHARASEKLLLSEPLSAEEAARVGLATKVLKSCDVLEHARQVALKLCALPPGALRQSKQLMRLSTRKAVLEAIEAERAVFVERLRSPEAKEAFAAFFEKRKPDFSQF